MKYKVNMQTAILFCLCFLIFLSGAGKGFWEDELATLADIIDSRTFLGMLEQLQFEVHAPGLYIIVYLFEKLSLFGEVALRIPSIIAGCLGIVAFVKIARYYLKTLWLIFFTILCSSLSAIYWHATEIRPHIFLFAFGSWIIFYLYEASINQDNENFYFNLRKVIYLFTASLFFSFGTFYIVPTIFLPFIAVYQKKFVANRDSFLGKSRLIIYPAIIILFIFAVYLFSRNIFSVLWGTGPVPKALFAYSMQSFGILDLANWTLIPSLIVVIWAFVKKKLDTQLQYLASIYLFSLVLLSALEFFGIPFSRPRYTLYFIPIPTLLTLVSLSSLKPSRMIQSSIFAVIGFCIYFNFVFPFYSLGTGPKILVERAAELLKGDPNSQLVVIGNCRNLIYYLDKVSLKLNRYQCLNGNDYKDNPVFNNQKTYLLIHLLETDPIAIELRAKLIARISRHQALVEVDRR